MTQLIVDVESGAAAERVAAQIWAEATARRDGSEPRDAAQTLPGVRRRLELDGAALLVARADGVPVGFAIVAPRTSSLEVFYLAVAPRAWGGGVGGVLLAAVDEQAKALGHSSLELWVIADNDRALTVYQRAGWTVTDDVQQTGPGDDATIERRVVRHLPD
ncbi:GNAT family N-acetyltransferase [Aeromicrobium fastidiosum]|uniref:GNAT family N-acetyltransferase n=1 Tax=Aeromicrobium fastidiosum TaxID=52699 RepID=UPI00165F2EDC|nr:GNAT family N-acetyltransferase [Aeromicrobium fastidiosum]MBP2391640.1 GNAT superfamily N-acetyltransferase [Aeromicrobium fastidiosum]